MGGLCCCPGLCLWPYRSWGLCRCLWSMLPPKVFRCWWSGTPPETMLTSRVHVATKVILIWIACTAMEVPRPKLLLRTMSGSVGGGLCWCLWLVFPPKAVGMSRVWTTA